MHVSRVFNLWPWHAQLFSNGLASKLSCDNALDRDLLKALARFAIMENRLWWITYFAARLVGWISIWECRAVVDACWNTVNCWHECLQILAGFLCVLRHSVLRQLTVQARNGLINA